MDRREGPVVGVGPIPGAQPRPSTEVVGRGAHAEIGGGPAMAGTPECGPLAAFMEEKASSKRMTYAKAVEENLRQMGSSRAEWSAVPINGHREVEDAAGRPRTVFEFDFPRGYQRAPSMFAHDPSCPCNLCGADIKNVFWIQNDSKKWVMPVGSECVTHFGEGKSGEKLGNAYRHQSNEDCFKEADLTRRQLFYAYTTPHEYSALRGGGTVVRREWQTDTREAREAREIHAGLKKLTGEFPTKRVPGTDKSEPSLTKANLTKWVTNHGEAARELVESAKALPMTLDRAMANLGVVREAAKADSANIASQARDILDECLAGVVVGANNRVDRLVMAAEATDPWPDESDALRQHEFKDLYEGFSATRAAAREVLGDTITLYRADPIPGSVKFPERKPTLNMATREQALKFLDSSRVLRSYEIPVEDIIAVPAKGLYHEFIVLNPADKARRGER